MRCLSCGADNPGSNRFCEDCGASLTSLCPQCGAEITAGKRFCGSCGSPLAAPTPPVATEIAASALPLRPLEAAAAVGTELRHVSVLFCDLVGFTPLSESKDPEEVRELLSGYFDLARAIVGRYGGVIQKFIGDAVMALWGAPTANEDDAERAVRAGLELASAVPAYGGEHGSDLQARVGIVTGPAATTETAEEGLVVGDRVNTAARIQSVAPPGCCYVDEATRGATAAAISYTDAGSHALKGKTEPVHLYQATRVIAAIAGSQRSGVLEAPFAGRDHELRLVKELFHACAERSSARLVLVSGVAGVGKSRLAWEFFKYIDGLAGDVLWHAGRCLAYGEGVSYWALSEMVRSRLQIGEEDPPDVVADRLRTGLERWIPNAADREFISPRLGQLLGVSGSQALVKEELFSGWRLFFERLAEYLPVVMVIEDLQWADAGMVEFLDHLLEWSGDHALYLLVLSRPEGTENPGLILSRRNLTTLSLDPLSDEVIGELLDGLVVDLPATPRARIVERAEGIPLYAVETVRSLLDKGVVAKGEDGALHLVGEMGALEIPPGLTALIASRLDALSPPERRVVKECSVLGGSFPRSSVEAVTEIEPAELEDILQSLVRKEVLTVRADKLSPEKGQYAFTQSLIRSVAYDMLSRSERKTRHLATAAHLREAFPEGGAEVAEVIAAHIYDAYKAAGEDPDAPALREEAKVAFGVAAERAESVGALLSAEAAYLKAAELSSDDTEGADFTAGAGRVASLAGFEERAVGYHEAAIAAHRAAGHFARAAEITAALSTSLGNLGRGEQAIALVRETLASLDSGESAPPSIRAGLQSRLGSDLAFAGHPDEAFPVLEEALTLAQHYQLGESLARALNSRAILLAGMGRMEEARVLMEASLEIARRQGLTQREMVAEANLADLSMTLDLPGAEDHCRTMLALARRWGARRHEAIGAGNLMYVLIMSGRLDEAFDLGLEVVSPAGDALSDHGIQLRLAMIESIRGNFSAARERLGAAVRMKSSDDVQDRVGYLATEGAVAQAEGDYAHALEVSVLAIDEAARGGLPVCHEAVRLAVPTAVDAALGLRDLHAADALVARFAAQAPGVLAPFLRLQMVRASALLAAARHEDGAESGFLAALEGFRELNYPYWAAKTQLDTAQWLSDGGNAESAAREAAAAAAVFEHLGAQPMLARARSVLDRTVEHPMAEKISL